MTLAHESHPFGLHFGMFLPIIQAQASDEQKKKWMPLINNHAICGTYAQTELGHGLYYTIKHFFKYSGSNLKSLEITATYEPKTQQFVLHSPTITATKWWPGNLGKASNYAVVMAELIIDGKKHGPHAFIVQLRDTNTHMPLKGLVIYCIKNIERYNGWRHWSKTWYSI
jgi:acyl-CoA oxidase